jgi:hypothetical protein
VLIAHRICKVHFLCRTLSHDGYPLNCSQCTSHPLRNSPQRAQLLQSFCNYRCLSTILNTASSDSWIGCLNVQSTGEKQEPVWTQRTLSPGIQPTIEQLGIANTASLGVAEKFHCSRSGITLRSCRCRRRKGLRPNVVHLRIVYGR